MHAVENPEPTDGFLGFCQWYKTSNSEPTGFNINSFSLKRISQRMKQKVTAQGEGKRVRMPDLPEFIAVADSEASDTKSPHFKDVASAEVPQDVPGGVGTAPMEKVEMEEEEEEDPDVHFKQKREGEPRRKWVVKKPRNHTPVVAESILVMIASPPAPLIIKLLTQKKAIEKAALGLGKISAYLQVFFFF